MGKIFVYNRIKEDHSNNPNNFPIFRPYPLGNPYTFIKDKETKAKFIVKDREECINKFAEYFDIMYGNNILFTNAVDEIYEKYKSGEDVYLECYCGCGEKGIKKCHGEVIKEKLEKRLIKEKIKKLKDEQNTI